jgi:hypothetical protein
MVGHGYVVSFIKFIIMTKSISIDYYPSGTENPVDSTMINKAVRIKNLFHKEQY